MKFLKKFEKFDLSQTLPITSVDAITDYYYCDECDHLWKVINQQPVNKCESCGSSEIEELEREEWYQVAKTRVGDYACGLVDKHKRQEEESLVDLLAMKRNKKYGNQ